MADAKQEFSKTLLITGGAGFIGSAVVRHFCRKYGHYRILNLDALTYAGNPDNVAEVSGLPNYAFLHADIRDKKKLFELFERYRPDAVIHLAAESHVDRSITGPDAFVSTNITGTANLLGAALDFWKEDYDNKLFYHISTDEVFGSIAEGFFTEKSPYDPRSPYAASKAAADHLVRAYGHTYGLPYMISNCSNNYGPCQYPEKLLPLMIMHILEHKPLPVYGKGENVRDWLYVEDHAEAIDLIFHEGKTDETYLIGGNNEWRNIDLIRLLCRIMDEKLGREQGSSEKLITYVADRPGHDLRYAIDASKLKCELGWMPVTGMEEGLRVTVEWYLGKIAD